jgi:anti-anti-sigma factor
MSSFRARTSAIDNSTMRLVLTGEIDLANADSVVELGTKCIRRAGVTTLVVDLGEVTFMDSTALSALVQLRNAAIEINKSTRLTNLPPRVARLLEMTGLASVLEVDRCSEQA